MEYNINHDMDNKKFTTEFDGKVSTLNYDIRDGRMLFFSTHVHPDLEGKGIASALTSTALDYAIENKLKIVPLCAFTQAYIQRKGDKYKDYLDND